MLNRGWEDSLASAALPRWPALLLCHLTAHVRHAKPTQDGREAWLWSQQDFQLLVGVMRRASLWSQLHHITHPACTLCVLPLKPDPLDIPWCSLVAQLSLYDYVYSLLPGTGQIW